MRTMITVGMGMLLCHGCGSSSPPLTGSGAGSVSGAGGASPSASASGAGGESVAQTSSGSGGAGSPASSSANAMASSSTGMLVCPQGAILCEGNVAKQCDGKGGFSSTTDCGAKKCAPNLGCVTCLPGAASCNGDKSLICNDKGTATSEQYCDPLQGMKCDPDTGLCAGPCTPQNLGQSYFGCDYYPTHTNNQLVSKSFDFAVAVSNTTTLNVDVTVSKGASTVATFSIGPNSVKIQTLPWIAALDQQKTQKVAQSAYRLRSNRPVTVYQYNPLQYNKGGGFSYTNDASLLLPVNVWSGNYRVVSRNHWVFAGSVNYGGLYAVVAASDNTTVTTKASPTGGIVLAGDGIASNGNGTVVLHAGDVLQVFTAKGGGGPDVSDLTGTLITADKPVQVIGGHTCTNVPYTVVACDHLEESMPPLETVADHYLVTAPLISSSAVKQRMVRIVATADNTQLSYDPPQNGAPASVALAGGYAEIALTQADFAIKASKPILVAEYFTGQAQGGNAGDPAMTMAVPTAQYRTEYLFHAPTNYSSNYVNIVAPSKSAVTLDGKAVMGFTAVGNTGLGVARVELSNTGDGNHVIKSTLPCGIGVYGYGQYTSYWYPGGLDLTPLGL